MGEEIFTWAREHFEFVLIAAGVLILIGVIFDWKWITRIQSPSTLTASRAVAEGLHGEKGRLRFERFMTGVAGVLLILAGAVFLVIG